MSKNQRGHLAWMIFFGIMLLLFDGTENPTIYLKFLIVMNLGLMIIHGGMFAFSDD